MIFKMKKLIKNFKRLFYWIPIIWNDRDYDEEFFWLIVKSKLQTMEQFFLEHSFREDNFEVSKSIHNVICEIDEILENSFSLMPDDFYEKKIKNISEFLEKKLIKCWD